MHLVMLETHGNQRYIFSSPRLRENIGASAQLVRLKEWTDEALRETGAQEPWLQGTHPRPAVCDPQQPGTADTSDLAFITGNPAWVSRASGKVIVMVGTEDLARAVISQVTRTALAQAPGIDVSGVYIDMGERTAVDEDLLRRVHAEAGAYALRRRPPQARLSQMPFLARATDSSLPASPPLGTVLPGGVADEAAQDRATAYSLPSRITRHRAFHARTQLIDMAVNASSVLTVDHETQRLMRDPTKLQEAYDALHTKADEQTRVQHALERSFDTALTRGAQDAGAAAVTVSAETVANLERAFQDGDDGLLATSTAPTLSKVAVIHADGNGVGAIMRNLKAATSCVPPAVFQEQLGCESDDADAFRRFTLSVSARLDRAVTKAFAAAWADVSIWAQVDPWLHHRPDAVVPAVPVVPVILGGDDVTVITSGEYALPFAASFLTRFEEQTQADEILQYLHAVDQVASGATQPGDVRPAPMTAAAGVAAVRRNFPFHIAYALAEKLVSRAKGVGKNEDAPCSTLDFHVLFDTTVTDPDEQLGGYKDFTTRPFRLVDPTPKTQTEPSDEAAGDTFPDGAEAPDASRATAPATWKDTCRRVARFRGLAPDQGTRTDPFPRTRATRIRKLLADGRGEDAHTHWQAAKAEAAIAPEIVRGGPESLFDLLELADLLPDSYLHEVTGLTPPVTGTTTASTARARRTRS